MMHVAVNILVKCPFTEKEIKKCVLTAARFEKKIKSSVEINIVSNKTIQELNRRYRGLNKPTDVLSFSWQEDQSTPADSLGQVYIAYPYIVAQARRFKTPPKEEFYRMLAHGLLHITGHDHLEEREAKKMFALQEKIVIALNDSKK
jgi:probable rRNA maturation factor